MDTDMIQGNHTFGLPDIMAMQDLITAIGEHEELPTNHHFAPGVYAREAFLRKGLFVAGKIHRKATMNIMTCGDISIMGNDGLPIRYTVTSHPLILVTPPGTKKIAFVHEDTTWINIHATDETDLKKIEEEFIIPDEIFLQENQQFLNSIKSIEEF